MPRPEYFSELLIRDTRIGRCVNVAAALLPRLRHRRGRPRCRSRAQGAGVGTSRALGRRGTRGGTAADGVTGVRRPVGEGPGAHHRDASRLRRSQARRRHGDDDPAGRQGGLRERPGPGRRREGHADADGHHLPDRVAVEGGHHRGRDDPARRGQAAPQRSGLEVPAGLQEHHRDGAAGAERRARQPGLDRRGTPRRSPSAI